ncbi:hypothetical protein FG386_001805 [Cryptosporidium ryanae]|uniref:uncharacterized protein n=1 Tax=Cryptosporidium ryanae TaxID=515981 RepID=UPI00351A9107|nr:hypothetical protein FG386_001805 [Cryptosporidium ryanae]
MMDEDGEGYTEIDDYNGAVAHYTQKTVSNVIKEWYIYTLKRKILTQIEDYLRSRCVKKLLTIIIKEWFEYTMNENLNRARVEYMLNKKAKCMKHECFRYWYYEHYMSRKDIHSRSKYIKRNVQNRLVKNTYYLWNKEYKYNIMLKTFERTRLLKSAIQIWYSEHARLNTLYKELIKKKRIKLFITYYEYCINKHYRNNLLFEKYKLLEYKTMGKIFNQWVLLVKYSMSKRYNILQWQINMTNNKMTQVINIWRYYVMRKKVRNSIYEDIKLRHEINKKSEIFSIWLNITHDTYREKTLMIISGLTARKQLLSKGFESLKEYLRHRKESEVLRVKSQLVLVCYIIRLFLRNSNNYCKYKLLINTTSKRIADHKKRYYLTMWKKYVNIRSTYRFNENIIIYKHNTSILLKVYRIWNYLSSKIITNKMIINCITMRINKNIKRKVFYSIYYLYQLIRTRFWDIFINLINTRKRLFLINLYNNMLYLRKKEYLENKLGDKIKLSVIYKNWKKITYHNRLVLFLQNKLIIKRSIINMIEYTRHNIIFLEYKNRKNQLLFSNIIKIWNLNTRKRKKILKIMEDNGGMHNINKMLNLRPYFDKWLKKYKLSKNLYKIYNKIKANLLRYYYLLWLDNYNKNVIISQKYETISSKKKKIAINYYFKNWYDIYSKKFQNRVKMNKIICDIGSKTTMKIWKMLKMASRKRLERKKSLEVVYIKVKISILRYSWNLLKGALIIDKTLERISLDYQMYLNKKRLILIYNHWRQLHNYIIIMRDKERMSRYYYYNKTTAKFYLCWREIYTNIVNEEENAEHYIADNIKNKLASRIIREWMFRVEMTKKVTMFHDKIDKKSKRKILYFIIYVYNKYTAYKRRIIEAINIEYLNSYVFKLQYNRVVLGNSQMNITLYNSLFMYSEYNLLKTHIYKWLKALYDRIQYKNMLIKESERLCLLFEYINKRNSLNYLVNWKNYLNTMSEMIENGRKNNVYKELVRVMRDTVKDTEFKINISDILYNNYLMQKANKGIQYWRYISKYKTRCRSNYDKINRIIEGNVIKNVFIKWMSESKEYLKYYLLVKYSLRPYKMYYFKILKYNYYYKIIQEKRLSLIYTNWNCIVSVRKELESKCEYYRSNIIYNNIKRNYMFLWYLKYKQKIALYNFYRIINVLKPIYNIYNNWLLITRRKKQNEKLIINKVETRQKRMILKIIIFSYRIVVFSRKNDQKSKKTVYDFWKLLYGINTELRKRRLKKCVLAWVKYSKTRVKYRNIYNEVLFMKNRNKKTVYFKSMSKAYNRRVILSEKESIIRDKIKLRYILHWKNAMLKKERLKTIYNKISTNIRIGVISSFYLHWKNGYLKSILLNEKYEMYRESKRTRVLYNYYKMWKLCWIPHRYIKNGELMINLLNKIHIHSSFHKMLKYTYYSLETTIENGNKASFKTDILGNSYVRKSYFIECKCTYNSISRIKMEVRFEWILDLLSMIKQIKNKSILETMVKFGEYARIREQYHKGFSAFESLLRMMILKRVWLVYRVNSYKIGKTRDGIRDLIRKIEKRTKLKYLIYWVNKYNLTKRDEMIVKRMKDSYNKSIKIKCYLIWCIKYHKNKRKNILNVKISQFQVIYIFKYTLKKLNEYLLYNKWLMWCRKAHDTIELVNKFRLKSNCFLIWNKYARKQKNVKEKVLVFYKSIVIKTLGVVYYLWKNIYVKIVDINRKSVDYCNNVEYKRIHLVFVNWKKHSLLIRNVRKKIIGYIHSKNYKTLNTYFKLWKFFNYYKKTRNERFTRITNIIRSNHNRTIAYRIFYLWKLKMIESLSLKNSIFLSWNVNNKITQSDYSDDEYISNIPNALNRSKVIGEVANNHESFVKETLFSSSSSGDRSTFNRKKDEDRSQDDNAYGVKDDYYNVSSKYEVSNFQRNKINLISDGDLEIDDLDSTKRRYNQETNNRFSEYYSDYIRDGEGNNSHLQPQIISNHLNKEENSHYLTNTYNKNESDYLYEYEDDYKEDEYYGSKNNNNLSKDEDGKDQKIIIHNVIANLPDIHIAKNPYEFISSPLKLSGSTTNPKNHSNNGINLFSSSSSSLSSKLSHHTQSSPSLSPSSS